MVYVEVLIMSKHPIEEGIGDVIKTYELLDRVRLGRDIVIRDDQFEAEALREAAKLAAAKGVGVSLLDTGRFDSAGLDWLIREGVRFYTSDEVRRPAQELGLILRSALKAGSFAAYFLNGPLPAEGAEAGLSLRELLTLVADGMDLQLSNRTQARDFAVLKALADAARGAGSTLVYFHHGPLSDDLAVLAAAGAWIHISDRSFRDEGGVTAALGIICSARRARVRTVVYIEQGLPLDALARFLAAGAAVIFQTPPSDYKSLQRPLETKARRRKLPVRASWLSTAFMP